MFARSVATSLDSVTLMRNTATSRNTGGSTLAMVRSCDSSSER